MKIAIPVIDKDASNKTLNEKFGRSKYFYVYDTEKDNAVVLDNSENVTSAHGAGIQTSSMLAQNGINIVIAKEVGPKATDVLKESKIAIYDAGANDNVNELINQYKANKLKSI